MKFLKVTFRYIEKQFFYKNNFKKSIIKRTVLKNYFSSINSFKWDNNLIILGISKCQ